MRVKAKSKEEIGIETEGEGMGNGSLRRFPLIPLLQRGVADEMRPRAARGAQLQPNRHKRSH